jgi:hypothetical protein
LLPQWINSLTDLTYSIDALFDLTTRIEFQCQIPEEVDRIHEKMRDHSDPIQPRPAVPSPDPEHFAGTFGIGDVAEK